MTIIAYRDGILAADTVVWQNRNLASGRTRKVRRRADGLIWACCGVESDIVRFDRAMLVGWMSCEDWLGFTAGGGVDDFGAFIVPPGGEVWRCDGAMYPYRTAQAPYYAMGASAEFVMGALAAGATAVNALRLAVQLTDVGIAAYPEIDFEVAAPAIAPPAEAVT